MSEFKKEWLLIVISVILVVFGLMQEESAKVVLLASALLVAGYKAMIKAVKSLKNGLSLDENFLMSIASLAAFSIGEMVEAVAIMLFYRVAESFEDYSVARSRKSITELMDLTPNHANVLREGQILQVAPSEIKVGEIIVVRAGEKVAIDGVIVSGRTLFDTASINGEPLPLEAFVGDKIMSGYVNLSALVHIKTLKDYENSTAKLILEMVENAAFKKSKSEKFITKFARIYTPIVVGFAFILAFVAPFIFEGEFSEWIKRAVIFLVVSCPCALVASVPLSFFGGIGGASKNGILIKGSSFIETLSKLGAVAFDKTGTLSKGEFVISKIISSSKFSEDEILRFAALAERHSTHPIAISLSRAYNGSGEITDVIESAGLGVKALVDGVLIEVGSVKFLSHYKLEQTSQTAVHIAVGGAYAGYIELKDEIRKESAKSIQWLRQNGIKTALITGDKEAVAVEVGQSLGIDEIHFELLPNEKVAILEQIIAKNSGAIAYVGDGINDAPVIARADVGVAMLGSDAAVQTADVVLVNNNISKLVTAIKIAKKTIGIAKFNIVFSIGFKLGVLVLAAFGYANIPLAIFADVGVTILAILNALRAFKI
ncbi:heavy metal translocating P-type ATPase [Campylobacter suis]|uniref:P-type Zn(2+) transporter n=1 Tax=Campylobacter suis TaxID=2790657 RepID=A0ABM8Q8U0_9BACT|nr:heavy metal translocating P-type ATPase [Campylobacter suis]CAD7289316.1 Zinc-transporting ATPase [Campylobacter suis]